MTEEQEKMARKIKSTKKAMKNFQEIANYEDVAYKNGDMSSSVNLSPSLEISKFEKHDGYENSIKHLGRYCHQLRGTKEKKKKNIPIRLRKLGIIIPLLECTPNPHSRNFDPHVRCAYHSDIQCHSIEDCRALKREIERMIQEKLIVVQNIDTTSVTRNPSSTYGNAQYMGNNELSMGIQNLFVEENVLDSGGGSSHAAKQTSG
ncbi:hypothetical protein P3S67_015542 [Capsicum chacoense]